VSVDLAVRIGTPIWTVAVWRERQRWADELGPLGDYSQNLDARLVFVSANDYSFYLLTEDELR
jgi:hypothetical protein